MKDLTRILSRFVCDSRFDALPPAVQHEGARAFVNWMGCAAGGSREDDVQLMRDHLAEFNGAADTTVVGQRVKLDALNAAFINSMSSGSLAFNDTHFNTVAHPTAPVVAVLLALAERRPDFQPLSGKELLHALILGVEVQCRVGNMLCVPPAESHVGLSMKGLAGVIGGAVAAGKALGLDEHGMATAIGHAANQASGLREAQSTMASHFTYGHSARCGLTAALLAARAAFSASPEKSFASHAAFRSNTSSPMATPPRGASPFTLKIASGRFCSGKSACPLALATQLLRLASWVSSNAMLMLVSYQWLFRLLRRRAIKA